MKQIYIINQNYAFIGTLKNYDIKILVCEDQIWKLAISRIKNVTIL